MVAYDRRAPTHLVELTDTHSRTRLWCSLHPDVWSCRGGYGGGSSGSVSYHGGYSGGGGGGAANSGLGSNLRTINWDEVLPTMPKFDKNFYIEHVSRCMAAQSPSRPCVACILWSNIAHATSLCVDRLCWCQHHHASLTYMLHVVQRSRKTPEAEATKRLHNGDKSTASQSLETVCPSPFCHLRKPCFRNMS